jgi:hypothetical protein
MSKLSGHLWREGLVSVANPLPEMIEYCSPARSLVLTQAAKIAKESSVQNLQARD